MRIPGYALIEAIGEGAMAVVYKAHATAEDRDVAVKILNPESARDADAVKQFRLEYQAMTSLQHRHIVRVFAEGEEDNRPYFTMEYVGGYSVAQWLDRKGRLDEKDILLVAESCMMALRHAWKQKGLVHADLKPGNVLVDIDGTVKLTDFSGLRRGERVPLVFKEWVVGTPEYMSPEQWQGMEGLDARSDMYALGAMMYHLACGRPPCGDRPPVPHQPFEAPRYEPVKKIRPEFSEGFCRLMDRLLAVACDDRFADWDEALQALEDCLPRSLRIKPLASPDKPVMIVPRGHGTGRPPTHRKRKTKPVHLALQAALCLLLLVVILWVARETRPWERPPLSRWLGALRGSPRAEETSDAALVAEAPPAPPPAVMTEPPADTAGPNEPTFEPQPTQPPGPTETQVSIDAQAQLSAYMDIMNDAFTLARRRRFGEAQAAVNLGLQAEPRPAQPYAGRLEQAAALLGRAEESMRGLAGDPEKLIGLELRHTRNHQGRIVDVRDEQLHVVREVGQGEVETFPLLRQLADEDLWTLMKAVYETRAAAELAGVMIAEGHYNKAAPFLNMADKADAETGRALSRWTERWQRAAMNLRAYAALNRVRGLLERDRMEEAQQAMDRANLLYRATDVFSILRDNELVELDRRIDTGLRERQQKSPLAPAADGIPSVTEPVASLTPAQLKRAFYAYDGRVIRLRFRARGPIDPVSPGTPLEAELGDMDDWIKVRVKDEEGCRWLRSVPLWDVQSEAQEVLGLVRAAAGELELVGRRASSSEDRPGFSW